MQSYVIELGDDPVFPGGYSVLAQVQDEDTPGEIVVFWVIAASEHGFVGIEYGHEGPIDFENLPGQVWTDVVALGSTEDPHEYSATTLAFERIQEFLDQARTM
jgi:hypothetical protein